MNVMAGLGGIWRLMAVVMVILSVFGAESRRFRRQNINIDAALQNPHFVRYQISCLLTSRNCDRIGSRIRTILPEMVTTGQCTQCSPFEVAQAGKVVMYIRENYPSEYEQLEKTYATEIIDNSDE